MYLPESQLTTWSLQGSITNSATTANSIKDAINFYTGFPPDIAFDVYLSGSYKNDTNIYGESDVDVVIELTSTFYYNVSVQQAEGMGIVPATYSFCDFKKSVIQCLENKFGTANVKVGNKAVVVYPGASNRLFADVLVCSTYRYYTALNYGVLYQRSRLLPRKQFFYRKKFS